MSKCRGTPGNMICSVIVFFGGMEYVNRKAGEKFDEKLTNGEFNTIAIRDVRSILIIRRD